MNLLTITIFLPLAGSLLLVTFRKDLLNAIRWTGMIVSCLTFIVSLVLYSKFDPDLAGMEFIQKVPWITTFGISYHIGIDGLSLLLVMLTTFLTMVALLSSWNSITNRVKEYTMMILFLETGMIGVFCAVDLFLFYVFWEAMLIPMYFIIGVWGGNNRLYAAVKFFLYTIFGSLLMLIAILWLGYYASTVPGGKFTTDLLVLYSVGPGIPMAIQLWMFLAFTLSFAIKIPLFPFHTWLPDAHVEAPTAGSVILAGVLLKMGTYGLLRFCLPLFPRATITCMPFIATLAVIGIVYGALVSMVQTDIKKLIAYSSVSHLGFVVLGILACTEESIQGAIIQMVNHGLSTGALFLMVGMIYDRRHTRSISEFGGLAKVMPLFSIMFLIVSLSSIGLPGLNGFIGEFLILLGSFHSTVLAHWYVVIAATGVILAAVYILWMYQRVIYGKITNPANQNLTDLTKREIAVLVPVLVFIVWIGVYPGTFLGKTALTSKTLVTGIKARTEQAVAVTQERSSSTIER